MALSLRKQSKVYLVGFIDFNITGSKLPSNKQVLSVFFYNLRVVKLKNRESASLVIREVLIFWEKARIPTKQSQHCITTVLKLYEEWQRLQKNSHKTENIYRERENLFMNKLDNLFDVAHADALTIIKIEEDKQFLISQRQPGRVGCLGGVDTVRFESDQKREKRKREELDRHEQYHAAKLPKISTTTAFDKVLAREEEQEGGVTATFPEPQKPEVQRSSKHFITPKLVAVLDRCQVSSRNAVYILQAAAEALGHNTDELIISKNSIQRQREKLRSERAENIKAQFKESSQPFLVVHWDGKMLAGLSINEKSAERLPVIVTGYETDQILDIPKLEKSTGQEQATAVFNALSKWELTTKVNALCCDTTASNTGRLNGACVLLEKKLGRDLLYLPCRHHIYELVLRAVFEAKLPHITSSPDVALFKEFKKNWSKLDAKNIISGIKDERCQQNLQPVADAICLFVNDELRKTHVRADYLELLELTLIFLNKDENKFRIRPPGAMHQARWMSRAIYCLKIFLFRTQYPLDEEQKLALSDVCVFIIRFYVKAWFMCPNASAAAVEDLCFLKDVILYEVTDPVSSQAAILKLSKHLWYLSEETAALAFFNEKLDANTRKNMVQALVKEGRDGTKKKFRVDHNGFQTLTDKSIDFFISRESLTLFSRLNIDPAFLKCDPIKWETEESFIMGNDLIKKLKVVNDTAERAVKLMQDYHGLITKDESQRAYVLQCVHEHRSLYPNCTKKNLNKDY